VHEDCFDYAAVIDWNAIVPKLWSAFTAAIRRLSPQSEWCRVLQYHARGSLHVHALLRAPLDEDAICAAARAVRYGTQRFGENALASVIELDPTMPAAHALAVRRARYAARYATSDLTSALHAVDTDSARCRHLLRLATTAFDRAATTGSRSPVRAAEGLGYAGHAWLTHSHGWGTSLGALRAERRAWHDQQRIDRGDLQVLGFAHTIAASAYQRALDPYQPSRDQFARALHHATWKHLVEEVPW
jgi:hypothetical protein